MALIDCPECSEQVSEKASTCPKCGYRVARSVNAPKFKKGLLITILVIFLLGIGIVMRTQVEQRRVEREDLAKRTYQLQLELRKYVDMDLSITYMGNLKREWEESGLSYVEQLENELRVKKAIVAANRAKLSREHRAREEIRGKKWSDAFWEQTIAPHLGEVR